MTEHKCDLEYCLAPYDFPKKYGRWQVRCRGCGYKSRLISDFPPTQESAHPRSKGIIMTLHKILMDVANDYANSVNPELDGTLYTGPDLKAAAQAIEKDILELIEIAVGENDCKDVEDMHPTDFREYAKREIHSEYDLDIALDDLREQIKSELRLKLKEYIGN